MLVCCFSIGGRHSKFALVTGGQTCALPISCLDPSFPKGVFALFIDGDSIDKIAPDGATIIVDPSDKLLVDRALYLMMNGTGGATVKLFFSEIGSASCRARVCKYV